MEKPTVLNMVCDGTKIKRLDRDAKKVKSLRESLRGIPPPPSITNPKIDIDEALLRLKNFLESEVPAPSQETITNGDHQIKMKWPEVLESTFHDIYYNHNLSCETLDSLYDKVRQRYVSHETVSFLGTRHIIPPPESPLPSDLLDLMPRSVSSPASAPDHTSLELVQRRKGLSGRGRGRGGRRGQAPKRLQQRSIRNPSVHYGVGTSQMEIPVMQRGPVTRGPSRPPPTRLITIERKTRPAESSSQSVERTRATIEIPEDLSVIHKKKLLWATTQALKTSYPELCNDTSALKRFVAPLFRLCRSHLLQQKNETSVTNLTVPKKGTSEKMLELANRLAPQVIQSIQN